MLLSLDDIKPSVCKKDRYGYIYLTTFTRPTDGRKFYYVGQHRGNKPDRNYSGSGNRIRRLINKYGKPGNTRLKIISWEANQEDLNATETWLIREAKHVFKSDCINLRYGGEGGALFSQESLDKMSKTRKGRKQPNIECPHCGKIGSNSIMHYWHLDNCKLAPTYKGPRIVSEETRAKRSASLIGIKRSEETKAKISLANTGKPGRVGSKLSEETKAKLRASALNRSQEKVECPHCGLIGCIRNMKIYHFENCKNKPEVREAKERLEERKRKDKERKDKEGKRKGKN